MAESGDYTPAPQWQGHDFRTAYKAYDQNAGRGYERAKAEGLTASKLLPLSITTESKHPLVIDTDFTGSMSGWDATIFSKLPYLEYEIKKEYLGEDAEISFGAICDTKDTYPLQIRSFAKGADMKTTMEELVHAGGGSGPGHHCEAHALAALYRIHNTNMPNRVSKPPYIIITYEMPYGLVTQEEAQSHGKVTIEKSFTADNIFRELRGMYSVYVILKPYFSESLVGDKLPPDTEEIFNRWKSLIGADHMALLPDPNRVVDVIFGILAKETNRVEYFRQELEARQLPDMGGREKVDTVYRSLRTVHALPAPGAEPFAGGHSTTKGMGGGTPRKSLMD